MSKIVFISPTEEMAKNAEDILGEFSGDFEIRVGHNEYGVDIVKSLNKEDVDVIVSRGKTAQMIRDEGIGIPIVEIPVTGKELVLAINQAKQLVNKNNPRIGYIGYEYMVRTIKTIVSILNIDIKIYEVHDSNETEKIFADIKESGIDVVIGGVTTNEWSERMGIPSVFLGTTKDSLIEAFRNAEQVKYARTLEKKKAEEFRTILDSAFEAIIGMDDHGTIRVFNSAAELFLNTRTSDTIGTNIRTIPEIVDETDLKTVLTEGRQVLAKIVKVRGASVVLNFMPIVVDGKIMAAILSFQAIDRIQNVEAKIREELYLKGNVADYTFGDIRGQSAMINETKRIAESFARLDSIVLIFGETGTGKELFAQSIHNASLRNNGPFVAVNCGAIPSNLIESELFGYVEGAFTGAKKGGKRGYFEIAHGGTIFLDEISEMDNGGQVMLLRVIQEKQIRRVGDDRVIPVDVRIIAATNRNLMQLVDEKKFREDLYYRLNVLTLSIPPLRDRPNDIEYLLQYFISEYSKKFYKYVNLSQEAITFLKSYPWYGNVRHLKSFCERLVAVTTKNIIDLECVNDQMMTGYSAPMQETQSRAAQTLADETACDDYSHKIIDLLIQFGGNKSKVAQKLGISRTTLWRQIKEYNIVSDFSKGS
jgi:transcriptional regulator with PAS, ATPase and Fis domain